MFRANLTSLPDNFFIVRTQAGFKKALKEACDQYSCDIKDSQGYPAGYPSLVHLSCKYQGYHYIQADCLLINDIKELIAKA